MTWLKLDSKSFTRVMRTRTPADMDRSKPGWKNVLNPNIMMMGCGFLIDRNIIFWKIFQNICWSFNHWKNAGLLPLNLTKKAWILSMTFLLLTTHPVPLCIWIIGLFSSMTLLSGIHGPFRPRQSLRTVRGSLPVRTFIIPFSILNRRFCRPYVHWIS